MKKGQMSLEMIIGLLILLVVAVVVIRMFLSSTGGVEEPWKDVKTGLKWKEFKSQCESYCNDFNIGGSKATLGKYCYTKMQGDTDLNRNGMVDALPADTKLLEVCEDAVYCFHVYECKTDTGKIDWDDCRQILCEGYEEIYRDMQKADEKVSELFPDEGSCEIQSGENWWEMYFGPNPCTDPGKTPAEQADEFSMELGSCTVQSTDPYNFECEIISTQNTCENGMVNIWNSDRTHTLIASHGVDNEGSINYGTDKLTGTLVKTENPQTGDCYFAYNCDLNGDNDIGDNDLTIAIYPPGCQIQ